MRVLVFGKTGQVAQELKRLCPADIEMCMLGREEADLSDPPACAAIIEKSDCDVVINVAAFTAVDRAEEEEELAERVNGIAPKQMALAAAKKNMPFLHVSTDYVFDGRDDSPFQTNHPPAPLGAYGRSKLSGEMAIRAAGGPHMILRTSWVFSSHGNNFVKTMLRLGADRKHLNVVSDQIGGPTPAGAIAKALIEIAQTFYDGRGISGTYHFSGAPDISWAGFAREIFQQANMNVQITDIPTSDYPTPAKRPLNSRLDCSTLNTDYNIRQPDWRVGLQNVLKELDI
ncbi:MAG TPA: dTDP-4-dehydrorhamnose reductase [Rhodobacteraceae bacterium]|nr:dTDP-4-dehydrorhamnose reductase [Paracoccaceae bacterium]